MFVLISLCRLLDPQGPLNPYGLQVISCGAQHYIHHPAEPAVTETIHHPAETHEEPIYKNTVVHVCNQCGAEFSDTQQLKQHHLANLDTCWSAHTAKKQIQTGTTTVVDKEAWDEVKVITPAKPAWDEKVEDGGHWEYK